MNPLPLPLTLQPDQGAAQATAAWFIPGAEALALLEEIGRWGIGFDDVRLCFLPRSASDRRACGVLAILPAGASPLASPSPVVQPYTCRADRIFLPADASLHPPISDDELSSALLYELQVFHPAIGLVGFGSGDMFRATDLISPPPEVEADWTHADPGLAPQPPLRAVHPMLIPTIVTISEDSRGDIGSAAAEDLPPLPDESAMRGLASKSALGMLGALSWFAAHLPRLPGKAPPPAPQSGSGASGNQGADNSAGEGWRQRLQNWSAAKIAALNASLARARNKELARLLNLLDRDMDEALRYALPLRSTPGRGVAPPGAFLPARNTDFDASALGRARPTDGWDTTQFHQKLAIKYRQATNRELGLGRYRRAAYIFAQLLGDYSSAANALRQGRFYREAATLYRDHMKDHAAAAKCLEEGGLLLEAIALYEELSQYEKAGDLYTILERTDEARGHYQRAADQLIARGDLLSAARLLDTKLGATDKALEVLESGWPQSQQAGACLTESFELMRRRALHERATLRLKRLTPEFKEGALALTLSDVLVRVATNYPSPELRVLAADATRVVVGNRLAGSACGPSEIRTLTSAVMRLAPQDRLLARDVNRYCATPARPKNPALPSPDRKPKSKEPTLVRAFHLGGGTQVKTVFPAGDVFYAIGVRGDDLLFIRSRWDGTVRTTHRRDPLASKTRYRIERADANSLHAIPLASKDAATPVDFGPDASFPPCYMQLPPDYKTGIILDLFRDEHGVLWSFRYDYTDHSVVLYAHDLSGRLLSSREIKSDKFLEYASAKLVVRTGIAWILYGQTIEVLEPQRQRTIDLHRSARDMIVSNPHVRPRLVVTFEQGAAMIWPEDGHTIRLAEGLLDPVACFTRDGLLVIIGRGRGMVLRVAREGITQIMPFDHLPELPVAIIPTDEPAGFAVFYDGGLIRAMKIPPE